MWKYHYSYPIHSFIDISHKNYQYLGFIFFTFNCICSVCQILVSISYVVCLNSTVCRQIGNRISNRYIVLIPLVCIYIAYKNPNFCYLHNAQSLIWCSLQRRVTGIVFV